MNIEPTDSDRQREIERRAKALFDDSVETLAPDVAQRLARARSAALAEVSRPRATSWLSGRWLTLPRSTQWVAITGGVATLVAVLVMLPVSPLLERLPAAQGLGAEDVAQDVAQDVEFVAAMNSDGDDIEMLQDLEFYSWLEAEPAAEDGGSDENIG